MSSYHPLFGQYPDHQWGRPLAKLPVELMRRARRLGRGSEQYAWVVLPGGATVGMRELEDAGRFELRIARQETPETDEAWGKWERELGIFLEKFKMTVFDGGHVAPTGFREWLRLNPEPDEEGRAVARFVELREGEITPGQTLCCDCGTEIPWIASFGKRNRCTQCGIAAGSPGHTQGAPEPADQGSLGI